MSAIEATLGQESFFSGKVVTGTGGKEEREDFRGNRTKTISVQRIVKIRKVINGRQFRVKGLGR